MAIEQLRMEWDELGAGTRAIADQVAADERLDMPMILPPIPHLVDLHESRVLIADDVADTGQTLVLVKDFLEGKVSEVKIAVLYEKPRSTVQCEYVWSRTDRWIVFPWSADDPVETPLPQAAL